MDGARRFAEVVRTALAVALSIGVASVEAGTLIELVTQDVKSGRTLSTRRVQAEGPRARIEVTDVDGSTVNTHVFSDEAVHILMPAFRTYMMFDEATLRATKDPSANINSIFGDLLRADAATREARDGNAAQRPSMPPAWKPVAAQQLRNTGQTAHIAGLACAFWDVIENERMVLQLCVASVAGAPGGSAPLATIERMARMLVEFSRSPITGEAEIHDGLALMSQVRGLPVLIRFFENGRPTGKEESLKAWRELSVPASLLRVPAGWGRVELK